jgi:hypothetical protein
MDSTNDAITMDIHAITAPTASGPKIPNKNKRKSFALKQSLKSNFVARVHGKLGVAGSFSASRVGSGASPITVNVGAIVRRS